jgi:hypothetical protein
MSVELLITLGASLIAAMIFAWLIKVVKATVATAFKIAAIALCIQIFVGIGPQALWQRTLDLLHQSGLRWLFGS